MKLLLKSISAILVSLLLWELVLENSMIHMTGYTTHPVLGRIYKQGVYIHGTEGFSRTMINKFGMRGPEISLKRNNEFRVLLLGDSYTEAFQLSDADSYTSQLQANLKSNSSNDITIVNAGRSGASPAHYIHLAEFYKSTFNPDFVVVQLNEGDFTEDILNQNRNFYVQVKNGTFETLYNSNFVSSNAVLTKFPQFSPLLELSTFRIGVDNLQKMLKDKNKHGITQGTTTRPMQDYHEIIKWTITTLKSNYPNFVILYLPTIDYKNLDKPKAEVELLVEFYAQSNDVRVINMRDAFISYYVNTMQPAHGFNNTMPGYGHTNKNGHDMISTQLGSYITREILK